MVVILKWFMSCFVKPLKLKLKVDFAHTFEIIILFFSADLYWLKGTTCDMFTFFSTFKMYFTSFTQLGVN